MNYFAFILLPQPAKMKEIHKHGILLAERLDGLYLYELFQLGDFYTETQSHLHRDVTRVFKTFKETGYLDPYLHGIDLSGLFEK